MILVRRVLLYCGIRKWVGKGGHRRLICPGPCSTCVMGGCGRVDGRRRYRTRIRQKAFSGRVQVPARVPRQVPVAHPAYTSMGGGRRPSWTGTAGGGVGGGGGGSRGFSTHLTSTTQQTGAREPVPVVPMGWDVGGGPRQRGTPPRPPSSSADDVPSQVLTHCV